MLRILERLFSTTRSYPTLEGASVEGKALASLAHKLEALFGEIRGKPEVVCAGTRAFVFAGSPPGHFSIVWLDQGEWHTLQQYVDRHGLGSDRVARVKEGLAQAYERSAAEPRFRAQLAGRDLIFTPSARLAEELSTILARAANW